MRKIIRLLTGFMERAFSRWMPNTFVFTIILTFVAFAASLFLTTATIPELLKYWSDGIWSLLSFAMQIVLILVLGHAVASSNAAIKLFENIAERIKTSSQAILIVTIVSTICCWLNPGFGLVAGAIFATAVGRRLPDVNYPLLIASAYSGYVIWHAGISGTIPLQIAAPGDGALGALISEPIPLSETVFSTPNLVLCAVLFVSLPILNMLMDGPSQAHISAPKMNEAPAPLNHVNKNLHSYRLENSLFLSLAIASFCILSLISHFSSAGGLSLNTINLILLTLGLILHGSPIKFVNAITGAMQTVSGVVLQYPFYGGIMGLMKGSGLTTIISNAFVAISSPSTFLLFTFLGAGLLNFFIPSGGGQWAVQAPIVIDSAVQANVPIAHAAMAVAYGDAWSNLIQPFWTLPVLAVSGLSIKHIMGYCMIAFLWTGLIFSCVLLFLY